MEFVIKRMDQANYLLWKKFYMFNKYANLFRSDQINELRVHFEDPASPFVRHPNPGSHESIGRIFAGQSNAQRFPHKVVRWRDGFEFPLDFVKLMLKPKLFTVGVIEVEHFRHSCIMSIVFFELPSVENAFHYLKSFDDWLQVFYQTFICRPVQMAASESKEIFCVLQHDLHFFFLLQLVFDRIWREEQQQIGNESVQFDWKRHQVENLHRAGGEKIHHLTTLKQLRDFGRLCRINPFQNTPIKWRKDLHRSVQDPGELIRPVIGSEVFSEDVLKKERTVASEENFSIVSRQTLKAWQAGKEVDDGWKLKQYQNFKDNVQS